MAVYVDNFDIPYRGMHMSHMIADTQQELYEMVDKIGVQRKWIQDYGTSKEHFDICKSKKAKAIKNGAIEVGFRQMAVMRNKRTTNNDKIIL